MTDLQSALAQLPVIGILRRCLPQHVEDVAAAAEDAGLTALEITLDSVDPLDAVRSLGKLHPGLSVGVGTVHSPGQVLSAVEAGARFIVSPHLDLDVVAAASEAGVVSIPGAATPTEVMAALDAGADLVKLFPVRELGGTPYVRAIIGPLGRPALVPTGGVDESNARDLLDAGSAAVGVGGALFPRAALDSGDTGEIGRRCRNLIASIR